MRRAAHNGCCRRVAQIRALCSVLWKLLVSEGLTEALVNIEIPLVSSSIISDFIFSRGFRFIWGLKISSSFVIAMKTRLEIAGFFV